MPLRLFVLSIYSFRELRESGSLGKHLFLVHGVCKAGGGWRSFATRDDFVKYLDGVQAAEKAGKIVVSTDYAGE